MPRLLWGLTAGMAGVAARPSRLPPRGAAIDGQATGTHPGLTNVTRLRGTPKESESYPN